MSYEKWKSVEKKHPNHTRLSYNKMKETYIFSLTMEVRKRGLKICEGNNVGGISHMPVGGVGRVRP